MPLAGLFQHPARRRDANRWERPEQAEKQGPGRMMRPGDLSANDLSAVTSAQEAVSG
jgi:hypothetical protein